MIDYLKPDLDELYGILPARVAAPIARWAERRWPDRRPSLTQHLRTTSIAGFLRVWALARLRVPRPSSLRFQRESALMRRWEEAVLRCAALDAGLAREVVETAAVVKGYGDVRRRLMAALERLLGETLPAAVQSARDAGEGHATLPARILGEARRLVQADERGIDAASALRDGARRAAAGRGRP